MAIGNLDRLQTGQPDATPQAGTTDPNPAIPGPSGQVSTKRTAISHLAVSEDSAVVSQSVVSKDQASVSGEAAISEGQASIDQPGVSENHVRRTTIRRRPTTRSAVRTIPNKARIRTLIDID